MVDPVKIDTKELADFAADLKAAPKELQREFYREVSRETKEVRAALKKSALATLPKRGGLAARVAAGSFTTRISNTTKAGFCVVLRVRDTKTKPFNASSLDAGVNQHPTYGHKPTITQKVESGWFTDPWEKYGTEVVDRISEAIGRIADRVHRG